MFRSSCQGYADTRRLRGYKTFFISRPVSSTKAMPCGHNGRAEGS